MAGKTRVRAMFAGLALGTVLLTTGGASANPPILIRYTPKGALALIAPTLCVSYPAQSDCKLISFAVQP